MQMGPRYTRRRRLATLFGFRLGVASASQGVEPRARERWTMRVKYWREREQERQRDKGVSERQAMLGRCTASRLSTPRRPRPGDTIKHTWHHSHYKPPPESVHHHHYHQCRRLRWVQTPILVSLFLRSTNVISERNSELLGLSSLWTWWHVKWCSSLK